MLSNYKLTPATLAHRLDPTWMPSPWLMYISAKVATAIAQGNARIIISVPPRHGKSRLITTFTSIWIQEIFRTYNIILTSYGADLSKDFGREVRNIIDANKDLLDVRISQDRSQAGGWKNQWNGGMVSVGLGGAITGRGANVLLIDDYIKEIKEALSPTTREYIWNWFSTTAYTRIEPGGSCIIIATRWHHDDLIGRLLRDNSKGKWDYVRFPAIAESEDILGRMPGEALFPERYPIEVLEDLKATLGTFFFNALYQQSPENPEAAITNVNWLKIISNYVPEKDSVRARVWDLAATENGGDFTTGGLYDWCKASENLSIVNMIRKQKSPGMVEDLVRKTAVADGIGVKIYIEQEPGSSGKALIHHFKTTVLPEFTVEEVPATDKKLTRAQPMLAAAEFGHIKLVEAPWNEELIKEFGVFPSEGVGIHDDQVDNMSIAYTKLSGKTALRSSWGRNGAKAQAADPKTKVPVKLSRNGLILPAMGRATWRTGAR